MLLVTPYFAQKNTFGKQHNLFVEWLVYLFIVLHVQRLIFFHSDGSYFNWKLHFFDYSSQNGIIPISAVIYNELLSFGVQLRLKMYFCIRIL